jgi:hypothetical protein
VIVTFGAGGDRDTAKRPLMGRAAAQGADVVIVTSDNLVDKARKLDIPILDCRKQGGAATLRSGLMQLSRHLLVRRLSGG